MRSEIRAERMSGKERTIMAIRHEQPDRVPLSVGMNREDVRTLVVHRYGSLAVFYETLHIDLLTAITPAPNKCNPDFVEELMILGIDEITDDIFADPDDNAHYSQVTKLVEQHGTDKCIVGHVWGVLEGAYSFMGVQETLLQLALWTPQTQHLFERLSNWSRRVAENLITLGIDVIQLSADAGANNAMLIHPRTWHERVYPYDIRIIQVGKAYGMPCALHSCGYISPIVDSIIDMGIDMIHPFQQSAGMDLRHIKARWGDKLAIHGGLDLRYYLPHATEAELTNHVRDNVLACKSGGGFVFSTEHTVQPDTTLDRVELAYRTALQYAWY